MRGQIFSNVLLFLTGFPAFEMPLVKRGANFDGTERRSRNTDVARSGISAAVLEGARLKVAQRKGAGASTFDAYGYWPPQSNSA
jgi:hypothetical protein